MKEKIKKEWYLINAEGKVLGRLSTEIAKILQGKHKSNFDPSQDTGDWVVVINCEKVKLTGRKKEQKEYLRHTGFIGGLKKTTFKEMLNKKPEEIIKQAVWGMLPKNKLRNKRILRLKIYPGPEHPHKGLKLIEIKG